MGAVLQFLLWAAVLVLVAPVLLLALETACALFVPGRIKPAKRGPRRPAVALLIPAHNEAKVIGATLGALREQLSPRDRMVVVADNCTDDTARIAARHGAEVVIRDAPGERGKGYALDCGIRFLEADPREVVIIVDADCHVHNGAIAALASQVAATGASAQALYLMQPHPRAGPGQQVAAFAFVLKNHVRLLGLKRLGVPSHLTGTGMAFPWDVIRTARLATGNIVEDMKLGADLVRDGTPAFFCPEAVVTSTFPLGDESTRSQRTRWEHGHLHTIFSEAPALAAFCLRHRHWRGLLFALDLAIPPLTLLCFLLAAMFMVATAAQFSGSGQPQWTAVAVLAGIFATSLFAAWWRFGRDVLPVRAVAAIPAYIASKFSLYSRFRTNRQRDWVRTMRD